MWAAGWESPSLTQVTSQPPVQVVHLDLRVTAHQGRVALSARSVDSQLAQDGPALLNPGLGCGPEFPFPHLLVEGQVASRVLLPGSPGVAEI